MTTLEQYQQCLTAAQNALKHAAESCRIDDRLRGLHIARGYIDEARTRLLEWRGGLVEVPIPDETIER